MESKRLLSKQIKVGAIIALPDQMKVGEPDEYTWEIVSYPYADRDDLFGRRVSQRYTTTLKLSRQGPEPLEKQVEVYWVEPEWSPRHMSEVKTVNGNQPLWLIEEAQDLDDDEFPVGRPTLETGDQVGLRFLSAAQHEPCVRLSTNHWPLLRRIGRQGHRFALWRQCVPKVAFSIDWSKMAKVVGFLAVSEPLEGCGSAVGARKA